MLNPNELSSKKFGKSKMGGYKTAEVDSFMVEVASLFSQNTRETAEFKRRLEAVSAKLVSYEQDRDNINGVLLNAQRLADSIVKEVTGKAEIIQRDAEIKAETTINNIKGDIIAQEEELARIKREVASFRSKLINIYRSHLEIINAIPVERSEQPKAEPESKEAPPTMEQPLTAEMQADQIDSAAITLASSAQESAQIDESTVVGESIEQQPGQEVTEEPQAVQDKAESEKEIGVKLNVRFDESSGEYIPLSGAESAKHTKGVKFDNDYNYNAFSSNYDNSRNDRKR